MLHRDGRTVIPRFFLTPEAEFCALLVKVTKIAGVHNG